MAMICRTCLQEKYIKNYGAFKIIDMVLVICDASPRDLGTTYDLIEKVILPEINAKRVLLALNKADFALSGRHFDYTSKTPDSTLEDRLIKAKGSLKNRIKSSTGLIVPEPVTFSAEYNYKITKVLDLIIDNAPTERRR